MAVVSDFTTLITSEHRNATRFVATVVATTTPLSQAADLATSLATLFDVDTAAGVQLDQIGLWVGTTRQVAIALNQYFSFDTPGLGFDQGSWFVIGDSLSTVTMLGDGDFRNLIRAKIACNTWDGTLPSAYAILLAFVGDAVITATEGHMSVAWTIAGDVSFVTQAILQGGYVPLKPIDVAVSYAFSIPDTAVGIWNEFDWNDGHVWG